HNNAQQSLPVLFVFFSTCWNGACQHLVDFLKKIEGGKILLHKEDCRIKIMALKDIDHQFNYIE
ncbi:hypothetical protein ACJX0J_006187, partial [Zea mays]